MVEVRLLGPVEVQTNGEVLDVGASRPARLLLALLVADRRRLDLDRLVERCWDDDERPDDPTPAVRTTVRRLRRALGDDAVVTRTGGYELDPAVLDVDVDRFDRLVAAGRAAGDPVAAVTSFRRALDLWRGRPFGELGELDWLAPERIRLEESHLLALEGWHDAHIRNGAATEIIPSLESVTVEHPMRERFHRQLMQALYLVDRQADALRAFQTYRAAMADAGLEPGPETVALEQRIAQGDPSLKAATQGRPLRGYRIVERLGEGAFSIVYRGTQPSVDRDVAIKQIRAELANRPDFIRRFEAEAHMVAHLEHPFVVPLYDYWREPGSAYLVMRLLPGGSLESSLLDGRWDVDRTARMVSQVGSALAAAHRAGVVHRDVKPANILLDDEGNSYLTDFGIALAESELIDPEASLSAGSPAYASPEQLRREPVGPSADVHGLAIAVYEVLTGRLPFPDEPTQAALLQRQLHDPIPPVRSSRTDVPVAIDDVLQRATSKLAADRYQTVEEFVAAFKAAIGALPAPAPGLGTSTVVPTQERNPYKGLRAFDEADAGDFAGRERLVDQLLAELATNRFLALVGPSGSGKSSAVRAGLLPALRRGAVPGSEAWYVTTVLPGAHPDEELEAALLRVAAERPPGLIDVLRDGDRGISRALRQVLPEHGQLLLVVDQFEELFTLCHDEAERRRFLDGLAAAITEERSRLHVVLTLRADFYDRPLRYEAIGRLVRDATVPVLPLAADELERAIVDPARSVGAEFEAGLVSEIVADVADQPGALPLLQYALTELYDRRDSNLLTRDAYRSIGGVAGALAARAEELHEAATPDERVELRRLFGRLVTLGEGTEDTRRRVARSELGGGGSVDAVIDRFGTARLLSFDRDPLTREPTVEVAHEAFLREWPRLSHWLDDDRDGLRTHRHLTETTAAWIASGRDDGELYRGGRLDTASVWAADHGDDLNEAEREFLAASAAQRAAERAAERAHAEQQVRSNRRLRILVGVATVTAILAATAGVLAQRQADVARAAERQADIDRMVSRGRTASSANPTVDLLIAVEAHRLQPSFDTLDALHWALTARPGYLGSLDTGRIGDDITVLADGRHLVTHTLDEVQLWDAVERARVASWPAPTGATSALEIHSTAAANGAVIAAAGPRETVIRDGATGQVMTRIEHGVPASAVALSADSERVAIGFVDGSIEIHRLDDGSTGAVEPTHPGVEVHDIAWLPLGDGLVIADEQGVSSRRLADGQLVWRILGPARSVLLSSDGDRAVLSMEPAGAVDDANADTLLGTTRVLRLVDTADGAVIAQIDGAEDAVRFAWTDEREVEVVGTSFTGSVRRFDLDAATERPQLGSGSGRSDALGVLTGSGLVAVAGTSSIELLTLDGSGPVSRFAPLPVEFEDLVEPFMTGTFDGDGRSLTTAIFPVKGSARTYDLGSRRLVPTVLDVDDELGPISMRRFGDHVLQATGPPRGLVVRRDADGPIVAEIGLVGGFFFALSPRGDLFATEQGGEEIVVIDVTSRETRYRLDAVTAPGFSVPIPEFTPEGRYLHVWNGATASRFEADTGDLIWSTDRWSYVFPGPDDEWVATSEPDGSVELRDPTTLEPIGRRLVGHRGLVTQFFVDPVSGLVVTAADDGVARVWDTTEGRQLGRELPATTRSLRFFAPGGRLLAIPGPNGYTVWSYDTDSWAELACEVAGRNMTRAEWDELGPRNIEYRATCEQYPIEE